MKFTYEDMGKPDYYSEIVKKESKTLNGLVLNLLFYFPLGETMLHAQHYNPNTDEVIREVVVENSEQIWYEMCWFVEKELMILETHDILQSQKSSLPS